MLNYQINRFLNNRKYFFELKIGCGNGLDIEVEQRCQCHGNIDQEIIDLGGSELIIPTHKPDSITDLSITGEQKNKSEE